MSLKYRKSINDEDFRKSLDTAAARYAEAKVAGSATHAQCRLENTDSSVEKDGNIIVVLFRAFFFGVPNEEKIKARDALKRDIAKAFENQNVNIQITGSGDKPDDGLYLVIPQF